MVTKLSTALKREIDIEGQPYVVHLTETGLRLVPKGRRKGYELAWKDLVSGEAALATALNASLRNGPLGAPTVTRKPPGKAAAKTGQTTRRRRA
jgi:hypothetical protein